MHIGIIAIGPNLGTDEEVPCSLQLSEGRSQKVHCECQRRAGTSPRGEWSGEETSHVDVDGRGREGGNFETLITKSSELRSHVCLSD